MTLSPLPLSYCTNVHPGRTLKEVQRGLDRYTCPVRERFAEPLAAGLWLPASVADELTSESDAVGRFRDWLSERGLSCHTLNAFPYGDFHSERVKANVYVPDWSQPERAAYTLNCARILAGLLPADGEGSISTVPLAFKLHELADDFEPTAIRSLIHIADEFSKLHQQTGRRIRLAIEPEPFCVLETTGETLRFFERLRTAADEAGSLESVNEHIGVCYDVCHQAVEFEDVSESLRQLDAAGIRINKVHITCAIHVDQPGTNEEARKALAAYVEPRYLHQTMARTTDGQVVGTVDLSRELTSEPPLAYHEAEAWRVHFHVPVNAESLGPLRTTRPELQAALATVSQLDQTPHLEVETYTWEVLPGGAKPDLVDGLYAELDATRALLTSLRT